MLSEMNQWFNNQMLRQVKGKVIAVEGNTFDVSYKYILLIGSCYFHDEVNRCWHIRAAASFLKIRTMIQKRFDPRFPCENLKTTYIYLVYKVLITTRFWQIILFRKGWREVRDPHNPSFLWSCIWQNSHITAIDQHVSSPLLV